MSLCCTLPTSFPAIPNMTRLHNTGVLTQRAPSIGFAQSKGSSRMTGQSSTPRKWQSHAAHDLHVEVEGGDIMVYSARNELRRDLL